MHWSYASWQSSANWASGASFSATTDSVRSFAFLAICGGLKPSTGKNGTCGTIGNGKKKI